MTEAVIVAGIGLLGTIVTVFVSARSTQMKMTNELQTQNAVQNEKIEGLSTDMGKVHNELVQKIEHNQEVDSLKFKNLEAELARVGEDIKSHNHYAQLFSESMPVLRERQEVANKRIADLENEVKDLKKI